MMYMYYCIISSIVWSRHATQAGMTYVPQQEVPNHQIPTKGGEKN